MDLCLTAKPNPGPIVAIPCWEQEGLDLEGIYMASMDAQQTEGEVVGVDGTETNTDN